MDIGSRSFIVLLLYLCEGRCIRMDISITELQSKDVPDFIPAPTWLSGLKDEHAGEATWFGLDQAYAALC